MTFSTSVVKDRTKLNKPKFIKSICSYDLLLLLYPFSNGYTLRRYFFQISCVATFYRWRCNSNYSWRENLSSRKFGCQFLTVRSDKNRRPTEKLKRIIFRSHAGFRWSKLSERLELIIFVAGFTRGVSKSGYTYSFQRAVVK